ncbi:MAG: ABC transporter permease [Rhodocyclaceae bacterium]|nr:ABC transporter permease [Rhodocyclaceae bacterium]
MLTNRLNLIVADLALAARNVVRHARRTSFAVVIISGGVIAFLLAGGFINWILESMREATIESQLGHVQISRPGFRTQGAGDPYAYLLPDPAQAASPLDDPSIVTIAPRLAFSGLASRGDETIAFIGEGIDPEKEAPITRAINIVAGQDLSPGDSDSVLMGEGLAANLGAAPGDRIVLLANTVDGGLNAVEVTIAGLFSTAAKAYDDTVLRAPIDTARELMRVEGATTWVILLQETDQTQAAMSRLRDRLDATQFEVTPWWDLADFYRKTVDLFSKQVMLVRILIGAIVVLSISNTLSMAVAERTSEIGTSMALGVKRRRILQLFVSEGAILGLAGGLLGVVLALLLGHLISTIGIPMPPPPGMARGYTGEILISAPLAADGFILALATTLLASILPARKASRLNVVDALRKSG